MVENREEISNVLEKEKCDASTNTNPEEKRRKSYPRSLAIIAKPHESKALTVSSLSISISLLSSILYKERRIYSIQIFMMMCFSLLFWIRPTVGVRRTCDITFARLAVVTSIYSSFHSDLQKEFLLNVFLCIMSFYKAVRQWERYQDDWYLWHMVFHILGNTSNIVLHHGRWLQRNRLLLN